MNKNEVLGNKSDMDTNLDTNYFNSTNLYKEVNVNE